MEQQNQLIKATREYGKQLAVSLVMISALAFGGAQQAAAKIYSTETFMSQQAKNIHVLAHPSAKYVSSSYQGNGVLSITYRSGLTGDYLTLRVQGEVNNDGHFKNLYVLSDGGFVKPFTVVSFVRSTVAAYVNRASSQAQNAETRQMLEKLYPLIASGNGQSLCEAMLKAESYLRNF